MRPAEPVSESAQYNYVGGELELFAEATNWKDYVRGQIKRYLGRHVVEVGAGRGGSTPRLCGGDHVEWVLLEPDPQLARQAEQLCREGRLPSCCRVVTGTLTDLPPNGLYDTLLYNDVLEHIEDDAGEFHLAATRLTPGGHLVVVSPAHSFLYSEFDRAIGHFRRYSRADLLRLNTPELRCLRIRYMDSCGMLASLANRLLLRQQMPSASQIRFWDRVLVRCSRAADCVMGYRLGKSILGVWQRME